MGTYSSKDKCLGHVQSGLSRLRSYPPTQAYGISYSTGYDGIYAYDLKTGNKLWDFSVDSGIETPYGQYPFYGAGIVADGKIFAATNEHSPGAPMWRGGRLYALDAYSGKQLWNILGWYVGSKIADGYFVTCNYYDGQIYCFGKGQTITSVVASPKVSAQGSDVLIEGTVMDQSPAQENTPAIADESMTSWMEYLNMQKPKPADTKGVTVHLMAIKPDGSTEDLGTAVCDSAGLFKKMWTPTLTGAYTIKASFEGSESYWPSSSETALGVAATSATPTPTPTPTANVVPAEIFYAVAAILAILMIVVIILLLRKK